ncbi:MAG: thioesterase [Clostridia bacterium]|nr:thioesterase [Clostridia bacterium]
MQPVLTERDYFVHYYEIDYKKRCLITSIMNYFEDIALLQSEELGVGIDYFNQNNIAWVLYKWDIKVDRYPHFGETIKVTTMPCYFRRFYAHRKFEIFNCKGDSIVEASSVWLFMDTRKKRLTKINQHLYEKYCIDESSMQPISMEEVGKLSRADNSREFSVRYSDIDTNKHVNNVKYVEWCLETIPIDIISKYQLKRLKVTYKKETEYGEKIKVATQISRQSDGVTCFHKILDGQQKDLCLLETVWER